MLTICDKLNNVRIGILSKALKISLFQIIFLPAGCTADGARDVLRDLIGFPGPGTYIETLTPVQDMSIFRGDPLLNYGAGDLGNGRVLMLFDLATISPASVINSVEFKLTKIGGVAVPRIDQQIHRLTVPRTEGGGGSVGSPNTGVDDRTFASRENPTASDRPKLVINYTIP